MKSLKNLKSNSGVTLLELLVAMSLMVLVIFAGSGVYLSGMNLSVDAQSSAQSHRNAQIVLMHIEKYVANCATGFSLLDSNKTLEFGVYNPSAPNFASSPIIKSQYKFDDSTKTVTFTPDMSTPSVNTMIFSHVNDCVFTATGDSSVLKVSVKAENNKNDGKDIYELQSNVSAGLTASPNVYTI
jgi:type II secretory pathway pseudopilin PulG